MGQRDLISNLPERIDLKPGLAAGFFTVAVPSSAARADKNVGSPHRQECRFYRNNAFTRPLGPTANAGASNATLNRIVLCPVKTTTGYYLMLSEILYPIIVHIGRI